MKIYEAWDELKAELEIFMEYGNGQLQPDTDYEATASTAHDDMAAEVLKLIDKLEMKYE